MKPSTSVAALFAAFSTIPALAHHSRANFDLESTVEVEGVVTEFTWRNPHAFAVVESTKPDGSWEQWTFELNSTPVLKRFGWTPDTLKVGDHVVARGNPDREPQKRFIYASVFVKDGKEIWAWGGPPIAPPVPVTEGSKDFSGVWRIQFNQGFDVLARNRPDTALVNTLPVTAKGQTQIDAFDPDENPAWDCAPETMPAILGHPYPFQIIRESEDRLLLRYEVNNLERIVHLSTDSHPADAEPATLGHSIGRFENGDLVIETVKFSDVRWGSGPGVDSGEQKTTVERYRLSDDGKSLALTFTMQDAEYLAEPVTIEHRYNLTAGYELQDYLCDPETSRRHLSAGEE
ncbi:MAG TPA: DUF6152 family protein [Gammaproteobacteria bacterium]|nr:DUF6152 family protein [Gammaproteobacteria bacterium]